MATNIFAKAKELEREDEGTIIKIFDELEEPWLDADGDQLTITAVGKNSKRYKRAEAWQRGVIMKSPKRQNGEESIEMQCEFVARCTLGWAAGWLDKDDNPLPFSTPNGTILYSELPFVRTQVETAMGDATRFLKKSSTNSALT